MDNSRRSFLKKAGLGAAAFTILPRNVFGKMGGDNNFVAPSDQLTKGLIGCGGIDCADNVLEMMMAGASAVEIGSAVYDNFNVFSDIEAELYAEDGIPAEEIVGCAHD